MFVFSSTGGVYAKQSRRVRGDDDYEAPIAVHSLSKIAANNWWSGSSPSRVRRFADYRAYWCY
jgi:hypothetical protein